MTHVAVIGAGVFGVWTAHFLHEAGCQVTLVDAYGPGNSRSSSGDESRILRCGYGPDQIYSRFARRSLDLWRDLERRLDVRAPIWHPCGVLWLAAGDDEYTLATRETLAGEGYPIETFDRDGLRDRFPQFDADGISTTLFEPQSGVLSARRAVQHLATDLVARGVRFVHGRGHVESHNEPLTSICVETPASAGHRARELTEVAADRFVFACGPWLPKAFPQLLERRIRPTRQGVVYFGTPGGATFTASSTPAWVDFPAGVYGVPDIEGRGLKVGIDAHGPPFDPDRDDRTIDDATIAKARAWLQRRFPAMADAPVVESRVCQYENTSTGDFLIDRHPDHDNVWIVGGGSGHGFKHGPAVGEYVTRLVTTGASTMVRFALAYKGVEAQRAVY